MTKNQTSEYDRILGHKEAYVLYIRQMDPKNPQDIVQAEYLRKLCDNKE